MAKTKTDELSIRNEIRLWMKSWRVFMTTVPNNKNERLYWFLTNFVWVTAWSAMITVFILRVWG